MPDPNNETPWWKLYIVAPVVAGFILLIAGGVVGGVFGRDDEHATTTSAPPPPPPVASSSSLTAGEFAQRANQICVDTSPRISEFTKPIRDVIPRAVDGDKRAQREVGQQIERFKKVLRERLQRLKALGAPQGEVQATAEEFVSDSSIQYALLAALSGVQDALKKGSRAALVNLVSRLKQADVADGRERARRDELALELGAEQCA